MFFKERKDTSSEVIAESMAFLNRKPKRQGSNQQWIGEAVFDDDFPKHKDHSTLLAKHPKELSADEKSYVDTFHQRLYADRRAQNPKKFAAHDAKEAKRMAELKANPFKSGLPKVTPFTGRDNWGG